MGIYERPYKLEPYYRDQWAKLMWIVTPTKNRRPESMKKVCTASATSCSSLPCLPACSHQPFPLPPCSPSQD